MEKLSRYLLVLVAVFTLAVFLPEFYWKAFEKPVKMPFVVYSCVTNNFMIQRMSEKKWVDSKGNAYSQDEFEQKLPLLYTRQLISSGTMPDSVCGTLLDIPTISKEKSFFRLKASEVDAPVTGLYPLFEAQSGRVKFELPDDFFRITWRIEFIDAATNTIAEEKSQLFSAALYHYGFSFPAKTISGIATTRKSCDEGYLIVDSKNQLFHLKMIKAKPYVKKIDVPEGLTFRYINCVDFKNKAYYAYLFSEKNEIYILTQNDYRLIKWPVEGYDPATSNLKIYTDFFNYTVIIEANDHLQAIALNRKFEVVDTYYEKWPVKEDSKAGKIFASVFPLQISMTSEYSKFIRFNFALSSGFNWIFFNILLLVVHFLSLYWRKKSLKNHLVDLGIVALSGIFGFIAVHIFQNKFFE